MTTGWPCFSDHRDDVDAHQYTPFLIGRTGEYMSWGQQGLAVGGVVFLANVLHGVPFWVGRTYTFDKIAVQYISGGGVGKYARLGIYNNGANCYPGTLKLDGGIVEMVAPAGVKPVDINQQLTPGLYWLALLVEANTTLVVKNFHNFGAPLGLIATDFTDWNTYWTVAQAYGALPDPFTAGGAMSTSAVDGPCIALRLASIP